MPDQPSLAVVDSSVVLKWLLDDEEHIGEASALKESCVRGDIALIAPQLMPYEFINGLTVASRRGRILLDEAVQAVVDLPVVGIKIVDVEPLDILGLAFKHNIAAYDAAYLALAEAEECDLWTGDRAFYNALKSKTPRVRWIGDYAGSE